MKEKIKDGYTNTSWRDGDTFYQEKHKNGFNHNIDYTVFKDLDFVPQLIENTPDSVTWKWVDNKKNEWNEYTIRQVAKNFKKLHNSKILLPEKNMIARYENYRKILASKNINCPEVEKYKERINDIFRRGDDKSPCHNDLYGSNVMTSLDNKIYFVDWEYATMNDKHFDLAFFIQASLMDKEKEKIFLEEYGDYSEQKFNEYKQVVCHFIVIWAYSQPKMPIDIEAWIKRLNDSVQNYDKALANKEFKN